jgi:beta-lactamase class C
LKQSFGKQGLMRSFLGMVLLSAGFILWPCGHATAAESARIAAAVQDVIPRLMAAQGIPGMAVGVIADGQSYVGNFGLASLATRQKVDADSLFEIGSVSKTFTATLAAYAAQKRDLALTDMTSTALPDLQGSAFDRVSLTELGTFTPGGMPLSLPDDIRTDAALHAYLLHWTPYYPPGTMRTYNNISIGLLGLAAAHSLHGDYASLLKQQMFPALGLEHSFIDIPADQIPHYAQGYRANGRPIRVHFDPLGKEAYGVRSSAGDMLRFLAINMGLVQTGSGWQRAALATHTGYDRLPGGMVQDLAWEQLPLPVTLAQLQRANGPGMSLRANSVLPLTPPLPPQVNVLINKTGSTNGFATYVLFIPAQKVALVLLANRNYPVQARIAAAYAILTKLEVAGVT